jgi:hypothetical protein
LLGLGLGQIQWAVVAVLFALGVAAMFHRGGKPHQLDVDVWDNDPEKRARNLRLKTEAWRKGMRYTNPDELERMQAECELAKSNPYLTSSTMPTPDAGPAKRRRLVRDHPMRAPHWVDE